MLRDLGYVNVVSHLVSRQLGRNLICILVALNVVLSGQLKRLEEEKNGCGILPRFVRSKNFCAKFARSDDVLSKSRGKLRNRNFSGVLMS